MEWKDLSVQGLKKRLQQLNKILKQRKWLSNRLLYARECCGFHDLEPYPHGEIYKLIETSIKSFFLFILPRGSFKTSAITKAMAMYEIEKNPNIRILIGSQTHGNALKYMRHIKQIFESPGYQNKFGFRGAVGGPTTWTSESITVSTRNKIFTEPTIECSGIDKTVTGMHYDLIFLADLMGPENSKTREQIEKAREYFNLCFALLNPGGRIIVEGTIWHNADVYRQIEDELKDEFEIYKKSCYEPAGSPHGPLLLPKILTGKFLLQQLKILGSYLFSLNYLNDPQADKNAPFKSEDARWWTLEERPSSPYSVPIAGNLNICMTVDPAASLSENACQTAIVVAGMDRVYNLAELESWGEICNPDVIINKIFELYDKWKPKLIGIEAVAFQRWLCFYINQEQRKRGKFLPIVELKGWTKESKDDRILRLQPRWINHAILLKRGSAVLLDQFVSFPKGKRVDMLDAFAYQEEIQASPDPAREKDVYADMDISEHDKEFWRALKTPAKKKEEALWY